jgi:hypothetical protein
MRWRMKFALIWIGAGALMFSVAGGIYGSYRLKSYVDGDPRLCAHCHKASPDFAIWTSGSHKSVACQRCHHSTPEQGVAMLKAFVSGKVPGGKNGHAPVEVGACAACHISHDGNWPHVGASRGHRVHYEQQKIACVTCHAAGVHGFRPLTDACRQCHGEHAVRAKGMAKLHCFTCHDFRSADPGLRPTRRDCLGCHRKEGVRPARFSDTAPMQFECGTCHKPHAASPEGALAACTSCHAAVVATGLHALRGHGGAGRGARGTAARAAVAEARQACGACHSAHLWRSEPADCLRCHGGAPRHADGKACGACHSFRAPPDRPRAPPARKAGDAPQEKRR